MEDEKCQIYFFDGIPDISLRLIGTHHINLAIEILSFASYFDGINVELSLE